MKKDLKSRLLLYGIRVFLFLMAYFLILKILVFLDIASQSAINNAIPVFFISFFLIGLSQLPPPKEPKKITGWLWFSSFILCSIGGGLTFTLSIWFNLAINNPLIQAGGIAFFAGVVLMLFSGLAR